MKSRTLLDDAASASEEALISAAQETVKISSDEVFSLSATSMFGNQSSRDETVLNFIGLTRQIPWYETATEIG